MIKTKKILVICDKHSYPEHFIKLFDEKPEFETYVLYDYNNRLLTEYSELVPDFILLDLDIRKADPIFFIKKMLSVKLVPIITFNSITQKGRHLAIKSLEYGAVDFIEKPFKYEDYSLDENFHRIMKLIKVEDKINLEIFRHRIPSFTSVKNYQPKLTEEELNKKIVIIVSGKGAVYSLCYILWNLPENFPPIIVMHRLPTGYTVILANKLNDLSKLKVKEAEHNDRISKTVVYVPPMDFHTRIINKHNYNILCIDKGEPINGLRPSVELMLSSAIEVYKNNIIALQLSAIHNDAIPAYKELYKIGGKIIIESPNTAVFPNIIEEIKENGIYNFEIPLQEIPQKLIELIES